MRESSAQGKGWILELRRCGFDPWFGKIRWRRKWQPTLVFLLGESRGQRSLVGYSLQGHKESDMTQQLDNNNKLLPLVIQRCIDLNGQRCFSYKIQQFWRAVLCSQAEGFQGQVCDVGLSSCSTWTIFLPNFLPPSGSSWVQTVPMVTGKGLSPLNSPETTRVARPHFLFFLLKYSCCTVSYKLQVYHRLIHSFKCFTSFIDIVKYQLYSSCSTT